MHADSRALAAGWPNLVMGIEEQLVDAVGSYRGVDAADRLCAACVELFAVDAAAISLVFDGANTGTLGASGDSARVFDELQFTFGEGPCLESVAVRAPVLVVDLADPGEVRWPLYSPAMMSHDVRSVFALPVLIAGEYLGALDLFRSRPGSLGGAELAGALVAAQLAQMPVLDLLGPTLQEAVREPGDPAWQELTSITRAEVSQATGMLMAQLDIEPAEALVRLRAHAFATGRSSTEVARDILSRQLVLGEDT